MTAGKSFVSSLGLLCLLALTTPAPAEETSVGRTLSGGQIEAYMTNSATSGVNRYGNPYTVWFLPEGRLDGVAGNSDEFVDSGTWWIEDDVLCRRWNVWLDGTTGCFRVVIEDDTIYWLDRNNDVSRTEQYHSPQ